MIFEDEGAEVAVDTAVDSDISAGTTTADIAKYTVKLNDIIRRRRIHEGVHNRYEIAGNVYVSFYTNGRYDEVFSKCFNVEDLKIDVINLFERRAKTHNDIKITDNDEYITELEFIINKNCIHKHHWRFEAFKQYNTQIIFASDDTDCKVAVYQHF